MRYTYQFDTGNQAFPLRAGSRAEAEDCVKKSLRIQSQVIGRTPPQAILLLENDVEVWRWTQADRMASS